MIPILLVLTATFRPAHPTVGDLITVDFQASSEQRAAGTPPSRTPPSRTPPSASRSPEGGAVVLDASPQYEIVSQHGSRVVIRTFEPRPFAISGRAGNSFFRNMIVPVHSVLKPRDNLTPSPLKPPLAEPYPRLPFVAIGVAALLAIAGWGLVIALERRAAAVRAPRPVIPPAEQFRAAVLAARRWAQLADALRDYLAATSDISKDLTTTEVIARTSSATISEILRQGDLEKFSPWGARPGDFNALANRALELIPEEREEAA